jgi:hypothetical protein
MIHSSTQMEVGSWASDYLFNLPNGVNPFDGRWHHVVATFDGTNLTYYFDGNSLGTMPASFSTVLSAAGLTIGSSTGGGFTYSGALDEVAVYNTVLSATQVQANYNAATGSSSTPVPTSSNTPGPPPANTTTPTSTATSGPSPTPTNTPVPGSYVGTILGDSPLVYYRLDETGGTTAADSSGHGYTGTYTARATLNQPGATSDGDGAISVSGQAVSGGAATALPSGTAARSVEVWFKTTAPPSSPYGSALVSWGTETTTQMFALKVYSATQMKLTNWTNAYLFAVPAGANTLDGQWHDVVATYNGSTATIYYDGQSLGTQAVNFNTVDSAIGLVLGAQTGQNDTPFVGALDEVAVYNTVLSATQVQAHYHAR